jgi:hypothetical protein
VSGAARSNSASVITPWAALTRQSALLRLFSPAQRAVLVTGAIWATTTPESGPPSPPFASRRRSAPSREPTVTCRGDAGRLGRRRLRVEPAQPIRAVVEGVGTGRRRAGRVRAGARPPFEGLRRSGACSAWRCDPPPGILGRVMSQENVELVPLGFEMANRVGLEGIGSCASLMRDFRASGLGPPGSCVGRQIALCLGAPPSWGATGSAGSRSLPTTIEPSRP